ncbi:MAG TPA: zf-HC2 domain-containing protein [Verrucomicrobiae bacterium]|jgi:anti-sigma factor RsiW|nr:zf-HC2 domain-containing protein [Verrucomicrobiae bacterium]
MNEHDTLRDLLGLAAAGALDPAEQRQVEEHLRGCGACRAEFQIWSQIAGGLGDLPTPQAPVGLAMRTRAALASAQAAKAGRWRNHVFLGSLVLFAWVVTLLSFPVLRYAGNGLAGLLDVSPGSVGTWVTYYLLLAWAGTCVAAALLGLQRRERRTV